MEKIIAITENYKNKTKQEIIDFVTKPYSPKLWGQVYSKFTPVILSKVFGDGLQLIWFQTFYQRPYYWYVFVDSKENLESDDFISSEIINAIKEEFDEYEDGEYPSLKSDYCGSMWGQECLFEKI